MRNEFERWERRGCRWGTKREPLCVGSQREVVPFFALEGRTRKAKLVGKQTETEERGVVEGEQLRQEVVPWETIPKRSTQTLGQGRRHETKDARWITPPKRKRSEV